MKVIAYENYDEMVNGWTWKWIWYMLNAGVNTLMTEYMIDDDDDDDNDNQQWHEMEICVYI